MKNENQKSKTPEIRKGIREEKEIRNQKERKKSEREEIRNQKENENRKERERKPSVGCGENRGERKKRVGER